jgi:hypothetical protein
MKTAEKKETKLIASFEEACVKLGHKPKDYEKWNFVFAKGYDKALLAHAKLIVIAEALNDGWKPNWKDNSEYKYYPWFWMNPPGFRFRGSYCVLAHTYPTGGSRLCFRTRALSVYAAKQFFELYRDLMVID